MKGALFDNIGQPPKFLLQIGKQPPGTKAAFAGQL
jgi:hypothetical protein